MRSASNGGEIMRGIGFLFLLVCLISIRAEPVSSGSSGTANSTNSSHKPSIFVDGLVQKPGRYDWFSNMTVVDAIEAAGGFTNPTNHLVRITRTESGHQNRIIFDADKSLHGLDKAPSLKEGDVISVPGKIL